MFSADGPMILFRLFKRSLLVFFLIWLVPLALYAGLWSMMQQPSSWRSADWSSTRILPSPADYDQALVQIYAARTGRWRGIFADHTWLVIKDRSAGRYERYDVVGWGRPVRRDAYAPDGRWYGNTPRLIYAAYGEDAEQLIPDIRQAISTYPHQNRGDYTIWPGPNSNSFVAYVISQVEGFDAALPPTAIGKDYSPQPINWAFSSNRSGIKLSLGGYAGLSLGWVDGFEVNLAGAIAGVDVRHPAIKLPGFGRLGVDLPYQQPHEKGPQQTAHSLSQTPQSQVTHTRSDAIRSAN